MSESGPSTITTKKILKPICAQCANRLHLEKPICPLQMHRLIDGEEKCKCVYHEAVLMGVLANGDDIHLREQKSK